MIISWIFFLKFYSINHICNTMELTLHNISSKQIVFCLPFILIHITIFLRVRSQYCFLYNFRSIHHKLKGNLLSRRDVIPCFCTLTGIIALFILILFYNLDIQHYFGLITNNKTLLILFQFLCVRSQPA